MNMFYLRGKFDTSNDYTFLSSLYSYQEVPYKAALVLQDGITKGTVEENDNTLDVSVSVDASPRWWYWCK